MGDKQDTGFSLEKYLTGGVEKIVRDAVRATLKYPKESAFTAMERLQSRQLIF